MTTYSLRIRILKAALYGAHIRVSVPIWAQIGVTVGPLRRDQSWIYADQKRDLIRNQVAGQIQGVLRAAG